MRREERVLKLPPIAISITTADGVLRELVALSGERRTSEFEQRLRSAYKTDRAGTPALDPEARSEDDFVHRNLANADFWNSANVPSYQSYVFLAPSGNVSFDSADFTVDDLPKDVFFLKARADGLNGRFIEIVMKTDFSNFNEVRDWKSRQLLVQGDDRNWVNGSYERLRLSLAAEHLQTRGFMYGNVLKLFWLSVVLLLFAEYRAAKWLYPGFSLKQPLSGTGALVMFGILIATVATFAEVGLHLLTHWFPYFEIEGNISRGRAASRKVVLGVASAIYTGAIVNVLWLVFGPVFHGWMSNN